MYFKYHEAGTQLIMLNLPALHHGLDSFCLATKFNFLQVPYMKKRHVLPKGNKRIELPALQLQ